MADSASIARPYAKAVFDLAKESGDYESWSAALSQLSMIAQDEEFVQLVNDPRVTNQQQVDLLSDLAKDSLPANGDNFLQLLVQNDRLTALGDIASQYADLVAKEQSLISAEVVTAMPLSDEQQAQLKSALETRLNSKVEINQVVDQSLLGGAIIKAGDLVIDGSAKGRIEKLTTALMR